MPAPAEGPTRSGGREPRHGRYALDLSEDGQEATIDSPENVKATQLMVDVIKNGGAPKAVTTSMEPESLAAFHTGEYTFMRNWPYAYALNEKAAKVKGKFRSHRSPSSRARARRASSEVPT